MEVMEWKIPTVMIAIRALVMDIIYVMWRKAVGPNSGNLIGYIDSSYGI